MFLLHCLLLLFAVLFVCCSMRRCSLWLHTPFVMVSRGARASMWFFFFFSRRCSTFFMHFVLFCFAVACVDARTHPPSTIAVLITIKYLFV
jgi:hypothetical protein